MGTRRQEFYLVKKLMMVKAKIDGRKGWEKVGGAMVIAKVG